MILKRNIFKEKREAKGLSLDDLASKINIEVSELEEIESFEREVDYKYLNKLKEILDINDQEIDKYFDNYYEIKSKESKEIKKNLVLNLSSFAYALCYIPLFFSNLFGNTNNTKYFFIYVTLGFAYIVGSYASLFISRSSISDKKYFLLLGVFTILFIVSLAIFFTFTIIICSY